MSWLKWFVGQADEVPDDHIRYTIAPGYERYVESMAPGEEGDYRGAVLEALELAGIVTRVEGDEDPYRMGIDW